MSFQSQRYYAPTGGANAAGVTTSAVGGCYPRFGLNRNRANPCFTDLPWCKLLIGLLVTILVIVIIVLIVWWLWCCNRNCGSNNGKRKSCNKKSSCSSSSSSSDSNC